MSTPYSKYSKIKINDKKTTFFHVNLYFAGFLPVLQESTLLARPGRGATCVAEAKLYDARILPKDLLTIVVSCSDPELAEPFNLTVSTPVSNTQKSLTSQPALQQYLVDNRGNIDFPVLGTLHIGGLTKGEAESLIREKLKGYIKENTIVTVRMANYKISVIGEVNRPGTFTISNEKVNLFEALAMAGDMTVYGLRDNVRLIREDADGHQHIITLNMNRARHHPIALLLSATERHPLCHPQ